MAVQPQTSTQPELKNLISTVSHAYTKRWRSSTYLLIPQWLSYWILKKINTIEVTAALTKGSQVLVLFQVNMEKAKQSTGTVSPKQLKSTGDTREENFPLSCYLFTISNSIGSLKDTSDLTRHFALKRILIRLSK